MKYCAYCGKELTHKQSYNIYCSNECSNNAKIDKKITKNG